MAGTCFGSLIHQLFAETSLLRNDGICPTADFQLVAVRIFKEEPVVAGTVALANFRTFQILATYLVHQLCDSIDALAPIGPKRNPRPVRLMISVFGESEKLGRLVRADGGKGSPRFIRAIARKTERRQQLPVKLHRAIEIFRPQINVIQNSWLHCAWIFLIIAGSSGSNPDFGKRPVSSRQLVPFAPLKTCLKIGSDSSRRFMLASATACQKRISDSRLGSTSAAFDAVSSAMAYSRSAVSLSWCS